MSGPTTGRPGVRRLVVLVLTCLLVVAGVVAGVAVLGTDDRRDGDPASVLSPVDPPEVVAEQLSALPPGKELPLRRGGAADEPGDDRGVHALGARRRGH